MIIELIKAGMDDCKEIHALQVKAFRELLIKYNDISTNPGAENVEKIAQRMAQPFTDYYFIALNKTQNILSKTKVLTEIQRLVCMIVSSDLSVNTDIERFFIQSTSFMFYRRRRTLEFNTVKSSFG